MGSERTEKGKQGAACGQLLGPLKNRSIGFVLDPRQCFYVRKSASSRFSAQAAAPVLSHRERYRDKRQKMPLEFAVAPLLLDRLVIDMKKVVLH